MRVSKNWVKFNKMFTLSPWSQGLERHGLVRRQDVAIRGLQLLTDQEACGQIYAIGDPGLNQP